MSTRNDNSSKENQTETMKRLNGVVFELKKDCYKFAHFYLTYSKIVESYYNFDKKSVNILLFLRVCLNPVFIFCKQVLEIINRGFTIESLFEKSFFDTEAKKTGTCTAATIDLLEIDQLKTKLKRKKGGKGYVLKSSLKAKTHKLASQVIKNFNDVFSSLNNIFSEIDKLRGKFKTSNGKVYADPDELKLSYLYKDFHKYVNNPFNYVDYLVNPSNFNSLEEDKLLKELYVSEDVSTKTKNKIDSIRKLRLQQMKDMFGKPLNVKKFVKEKYRKKLATLLSKMDTNLKSEPKITLPSKKRSIEITTNYDLFGKNFSQLYKLLLKNLERLVSQNLLILAIIKEENVYSKINASFSDKVFTESRETIEAELPSETSKNKRDLLPNYVSKLFINECISVIDTLPCMTEDECQYTTRDLPQKSVSDSTVLKSVKEKTSVNTSNTELNGIDLKSANFRSGRVESSNNKAVTPRPLEIVTQHAKKRTPPETAPKPANFKMGKVESSVTPESEVVRVYTANKGTQKRQGPPVAPKPKRRTVKVKSASVKNSAEVFKTARQQLRSVKRKSAAESTRNTNPELREFLTAREGLRKTEFKLNNTNRDSLLESVHHNTPTLTEFTAGKKKSKKKKGTKSKK